MSKSNGFELWVSCVAVVISLISLSLSYVQLASARDMNEATKKHNMVSVRPKLSITPHAQGPDGKNGIYISNDGLGPAIITGFSVTTKNGRFDTLGSSSWEEILGISGINRGCFSVGWPDSGATLHVGFEIELLEISKSASNRCSLEILKLVSRDDIKIEIDYSSFYEEETFKEVRSTKINSSSIDRLSVVLSKIDNISSRLTALKN